jgi:hypothetical protein
MLATVQALVREGRWVPTFRAVAKAAELKLDQTDIQACVLALVAGDFHKTMESETVPGTMQDVYKRAYSGRRIYLKLQISTEPKTVVIQFKKDESR